MVSKEKFEESKYGCSAFECEYGKCRLSKHYCCFRLCPIVFWVNVNEERN